MEREKNEITKAVIKDVNSRLKGITLEEMNIMNGGRLWFIIYETEDLFDTDIVELDLSVRASNGLRRAGFLDVGTLVRSINSSEDLRKIRNLGEKSIKEIMFALFVFQYMRLGADRRDEYVKKFMDLNL